MNPTTVAPPDTGDSDILRPRHERHMGKGGWVRAKHSSHRATRKTPSFPEDQNSALPSVGCGSGRTAGRDSIWGSFSVDTGK
ncbi:hypothetical protein GCM10027590_30700 [Nocardiopsis nanhaiensis]